MIVDHEISDGTGRIRLAAVVDQHDVDPLTVVVGDYVRDARCSSIEIDMIAVMDIGALAVGALRALQGMASILGTPLSVVGSHGEVRTRLKDAGLLGRD